jgi:hypothetical protein
VHLQTAAIRVQERPTHQVPSGPRAYAGSVQAYALVA